MCQVNLQWCQSNESFKARIVVDQTIKIGQYYSNTTICTKLVARVSYKTVMCIYMYVYMYASICMCICMHLYVWGSPSLEFYFFKCVITGIFLFMCVLFESFNRIKTVGSWGFALASSEYEAKRWPLSRSSSVLFCSHSYF